MENKMSSRSSPSDEVLHQFSCKFKICLFCVETIGENVSDFNEYQGGQDDDDDSGQGISQENFVQGISILCNKLNVDQKYGSMEEWSLFGNDNFVGLLCCKNCGSLLSRLVSLHRLIAETEASLKLSVQKVEDSIILSESRKDGQNGEIEYSINACVQFREEILKNFSKKCQQNKHKVDEVVQTSSGKSKRTRRTSPRQSNQVLKSPYVKLERLDLSSALNSRTRQGQNVENTVKTDNDINITLDSMLLDREDDDDDNINDDEAWSPPEPIMSAEENDDNDGDGDFKPVRPRRRRGGVGGKPRKRGRPRQPRPTELAKVPKKRGRPRKVKNNKDYEEYQPEPGSASEEDKNDEVEGKAEKKKRVYRGKKIGGRYYRMVYDNALQKPIYVLDSTKGIFMFFNVKFQRESNTLVCQHPDCSYSIQMTGYFTDQVAFRSIRFHVRHHHRSRFRPGDDPNIRQYYCHHCDTQFCARDELAEHKRSVHADKDLPPVLCDVCGCIMSHNSIMKHTISHKNMEEKTIALEKRATKKGRYHDISQPLQFPCDECGKTFKCHTDLTTHKTRHIPLEIRRQHICENCGDKFASIGSLNNHMSRVHLKDKAKTLECYVCYKTFFNKEKSKYQAHIRSHTGEKPYQCTECGKNFHCKWNLTNHERLHSDVGVTCEFCSNVYKNVKYLKKHHLKHHPELVPKPGPSVTDKYKPLVHRSEFFGPKLMYPCEPCGHVYQFKSMLTSHLERMHEMKFENKEDYPCQWTFEDQCQATGEFKPSFRGRYNRQEKKMKNELEMSGFGESHQFFK